MKKFLTFFCLLLIVSLSSFAQNRHALVIGNSNYTGISRLTNPVNDANDMEAALRALGFTVEKVLNGSLEQMENAVINLERRLGGSRDSYGFFFYAGHGVQESGDNFLIPVTADNIRNETQLRSRAVSLQFVFDTLNKAGNELNMIVLDACRDNPFGWARSGSRGLSVVSHAPSGTIVMYAAGAGQSASDGTGRNGLFTGHLLSNLRTPGLSVFDVFDKTMTTMINATNGAQHPELSLRAGGTASMYLGPQPAPRPAPAIAVQPAPATPTPVATPAAVPIQPPPGPHTPPEMVRINSGTFKMGSPRTESNHDPNEVQHEVTLSAFYMGKYEVTQKEYENIVGYNPSNFKGDNLPVENVTWFDAVEYCNKLSEREGLTPMYTITERTPATGYPITAAIVTANWNNNGYRLPTEAEWEYACRAGTTTAYNTGRRISDNTGWYKANSLNCTKTIGQKPANAWGLYDMHGNVLEWCWDLYGAYESGKQTNPRGAISNYGKSRVSRGGCWIDPASNIRSAHRSNDTPDLWSGYIGFRVVRQ